MAHLGREGGDDADSVQWRFPRLNRLR
jgi:hypothetical protein